MSRAVLVTALLLLFGAQSADARSCKPKAEQKGCVIKQGLWGQIKFAERSSVVTISGARMDSGSSFRGALSADYPSAPANCMVGVTSNSAGLFGQAPVLKGPFKVGSTYKGSKSYSISRGQPGFNDPGQAFGGGTIVQSLSGSFSVKVTIVSARKVKITATGDQRAALTYTTPNSKPPDTRAASFRCRGTDSFTLSRGRY